MQNPKRVACTPPDRYFCYIRSAVRFGLFRPLRDGRIAAREGLPVQPGPAHNRATKGATILHGVKCCRQLVERDGGSCTAADPTPPAAAWMSTTGSVFRRGAAPRSGGRRDGPARPSCGTAQVGYGRDPRVLTPSPERSARAAFLPSIAITSESTGPATSAPFPVDHSASVAPQP